MAARHAHPLKEVTSLNGWFCNQCHTGNLRRTDPRYRCGECPDFDLCRKCYTSSARCDAQHPTKLVNYGAGGTWFCDQCHVHDNPSAPNNTPMRRFRCSVCSDFDMCHKCHAAAYPAAPQAPVAAPAAPAAVPVTRAEPQRFPIPPLASDVTPGNDDSGLTLTVKMLTGKTIYVTVSANATTLDLKKAVQDKEGIPPDQMRMVYAGHQLEDDYPLRVYNILNGASLHLLLRLRD